MHKIKSALLIFMGFYCSIAYTQNIKIGMQTGLGSYKMDELKWFTSSIYKSLPFQAKIISNYPSYIYYKPSIVLSYNNLSLGFQIAQYSTGSRISSKDYSGEYLFDTKINGTALGYYIDFGGFSVFKKFKISPFLESGIIFSEFKLKEYFTLNSVEITNSTFKLKSKNYYSSVGFKIEYTISKLFCAEINSGYSVQYGKINLKTDQGGSIHGNHGDIQPSWEGLQTGFALFFTFPM